MTAVMRRLACLLLVLIAIPAARADLQPLASAAYSTAAGSTICKPPNWAATTRAPSCRS